ncbi:disulfide bond corrector protein DsbC [mine drainage metagenome]|uniref:Disulfide bond corrector protein DsbC n=1 Tax=mine drainage metagenome TaxID=410659 RepID=A0A1J5Q4C4_9ZZZZ
MNPRPQRLAVASFIALALLVGATFLIRAAEHPGFTPGAAANLVDSSAKVRAGAAIDGPNAVVTLRIEPGWHVYANPPSAPYLIPATVVVQRSGRELDLHPLYPPGQDIGLRVDGKTIRVYENGTRIGLPGLSSLRDVRIQVHVQACADKGLCLPPGTVVASSR